MKKKFVIINTIIIGILLSSCELSISPQLLSIEFIDDRTIEYEFAFVIGENASARYYRVNFFSIIPDDEYKIVENTYEMTNGKIVFNKDIPDGVTVKLDFEDSEGNYVLTHTFVKGEESESL
jgi:hypothetical protein